MIKPLHDNVIVRLKESEKVTSTGLFIVDSQADLKIQEGFIESISETADGIKVKVGDKVLFGMHAGTKFEVQKTKYLIMDYKEILAILPPDEIKKETTVKKEIVADKAFKDLYIISQAE